MKRFGLVIILFLLLIFRLWLATIAHHGDLNNNISWGEIARDNGLTNFYDEADSDMWPYSAPNQPPLTILMFSGVMSLEKTISSKVVLLNNNIGLFPSQLVWWWEANGTDLMVKLPSILADFGIAYFIYKYFLKQNKKNLGIKLAFVWLLNPIVWYNSSVWGQTDSIVNLLGLVAILYLLNKQLVKFAIFITLSVLFKGSLFVFAPVLLFVVIKQKYDLLILLKAGLVCFITIFLVSIWFHPFLDFPMWIINLYQTRILPGEIGYLTANAFNFWWLINSGKVYDSVIYFGLPARIWSIVIAMSGIVIIIYNLNKTKINNKLILFSLVLSSLIIFLFMTRIHERYLYPFFPIATILLGFIPAITIPYIILSVIHLLNLYHMFWAPSIAPLEILYLNPLFPQLLSVASLLCLIWILRIYFKKYCYN